MGQRIYLPLLLSIFVSGSLSAGSFLKESVINGYRVSLYDVEEGEEMKIAYVVPFGSLTDTVKETGLAHFFEHIMGKGSLKFPGHGRLNAETLLIAGSRNASTADHWTRYFISVNDGNAQRAIELLGAGISGLEFNPDTFNREREVVINEIVEQGMKQDLRMARNLPLYLLLPEGHPLKKMRVGDLESLRAMTLEEHKKYYYTDYAPENVRIALAANFKGGRLKVEDVEKWIAESFRVADIAHDPAGYKLPETAAEESAKLRSFPELVSASNQAKALYASSASHGKEYLLSLHFDFGETAERATLNTLALEILASYMNLKFPGSYTDDMLNERRWRSKEGFDQLVTLNNRALYEITWQLTKDGYENRWALLKAFHELMADVAKFGIEEETLRLLKEMAVTNVKEQSKRASTLVDHAIDYAFDDSQRDLRELRIEEAMAAVTQEALQDAARRFDPERALYSFIAPTVKSELVEAKTGRAYEIVDVSAEVAQLAAARAENPRSVPVYQPRIAKVENIERRTEALKRENTSLTKLKGENELLSLWLEEKHAEAEGSALALKFSFAASAKELVALRVREMLFKKKFQSELAFLMSKGVLASVSAGGRNLVFRASGNSLATLKALGWLQRQFLDFDFNQEELSKLLKTAREEHTAKENAAHPGVLAAQRTIRSIELVMSTEDFLSQAEAMNVDEHFAACYRAISKGAERTMVAVGDYSPQEVNHVATRPISDSLVGYEPVGEPEATADLLSKSHREIRDWSLAPGLDDTSFGISRAFRGPAFGDLKASAAFHVWAGLLRDRIMDENRSRRELGYVHGAVQIESLWKAYNILLYGQNGQSQNLPVLLSGWQVVLDAVRDQSLIDEATFAKLKATQIQRFEQAASTNQSTVEGYLDSLAEYANPHQQQQLAKALRELSLADFYAVGQKYIAHNTSYAQHIVSSESTRTQLCELALVNK
jgi:secreted Zn-dependent insulinase-like peptidase